MQKSVIALLLALLVLTGSVGAAAAQNNDAAKLGIAPVGKTGPYFDVNMKPGEQREFAVRLGNFGAKEARARTYAANVYTIENGGLGAKLADDPTSGVTRWLDYAPEVLDLDPGTSVERAFTVTVPADAGPGQHITSLVIQNADPITGSGAIAINQINRQVIAVLITVPGPLHPDLKITDASYKLTSGGASVLIAIKNSGNILLKPAGEAVVKDDAGKEIANAQFASDSVYAGTDTRIALALPQPLQAGTYTVSVSLSDAMTKFSAEADALPLTVAAVDASGSPVAKAPKISIAAVGVNELRDSSTKALQGVELVAAVDNPLQPIANARLTLHVSRDGQNVEDYVLGSSLTIPNGASEIRQRYLPVAGWTPGSWSFSVTLDAVGPNNGGVVELATASAAASVTVP